MPPTPVPEQSLEQAPALAPLAALSFLLLPHAVLASSTQVAAIAQ